MNETRVIFRGTLNLFPSLCFHHHFHPEVSRLSIHPVLFLLLTWPLISCFPLSLLTQDWWAILCRCPLTKWQSAWLSTDFKLYHTLFKPQVFLYSFSKEENDRQAFWLFTFSELQHSVTSDCFWFASSYGVLTESLHMMHHRELCDIWNMPRHVTINELSVWIWVIPA